MTARTIDISRPRARRHQALFLAAALLSGAPAMAQDGDRYLEDVRTAEAHALRGRFSKARAVFETILEDYAEEEGDDRPGPAAMAATRRGLLHLDLIRGDYARVAKMFAGLPAAEQQDPRAIVLAARAQLRVGAYEPAVASLREAIDKRGAGNEARYLLGRGLEAAGKLEEARKVFEDAVAAADRTPVRDALEICYLARCRIALGGRSNLESAASLLVEAARAAPERYEARSALGELYFRVYRESKKGPTAESVLKGVFEQNGDREDALLTMYRSRSFNMWLDSGKTAEFLDRALSLNPNSVPAMVLRASRMIDDRLFEAGAAQLDKALQVNPRDREALSHRAAVALLLHDTDGEKEFRARAAADHPRYAELDVIVGDHLTALYRFADAIPYFREALKLDPEHVPAMHGLAKALVYTGGGQEAVEWLNKAKELESGFADSWRTNILLSEKRLAEEYDAVQSEHFVFLMHKEDRAVLEDYVTKWYEDAYQFLGGKYGYKPQNKVRVEVLHEWVDFSVRTIGFRGFSALGACFGEFITMVSPSDPDLRINDFMWSATAWHEYAHVLTLALSKHRVPRWLTEGLSVHEESAKNKTWERGMQRDLFDAYHNAELPPLRLLNRLFRGERILFGYFYGGQVVEYLAEHHGFAKVVSMLKGYGEDLPTEQIFERTFGYSTREFDQRFRKWIEEKKLAGLKMVPRYTDKTMRRLQARAQDDPKDLDNRVQLGWAYLQRDGRVEAGIQAGAVLRSKPDHPMGTLLYAELLRMRKDAKDAMETYAKGFGLGADDFECRMNYGKLLEKADRLDDALRQYQAAKACWPRCTDQHMSPLLAISRVLTKQGKRTEAMMEVKTFCARTARAFTPRMELADYERALGNRKAEAQYLEEAVQIDPFMRLLHDRLGDAYVALGDKERARQEYRVALAVPTAMDRAWVRTPPQQRPTADSAGERLERGKLCVKLARVCFALGDKKAAAEYLDRGAREAPDTEVSDEVLELRAKWGL